MSDKAARGAKFEQAFQTIRDELIEHIKGEGMHDEANLDYNVPGGKLNRGMSVVDTASPRPSTSAPRFWAGASSCSKPSSSSRTT
ncbi:hypothetical protein DFP72DRAFT_1093172 [Ephemerocybe angulata]|uniref:Uncharacterized protein n=1 Tax=Ephemerocybe angulata TaxID=980116 RepID=A0A8H6HFF7_9AGAR|nr:hypothetical protein DFP72DRAFT_1093172 [Tulosesus angulatus]